MKKIFIIQETTVHRTNAWYAGKGTYWTKFKFPPTWANVIPISCPHLIAFLAEESLKPSWNSRGTWKKIAICTKLRCTMRKVSTFKIIFMFIFKSTLCNKKFSVFRIYFIKNQKYVTKDNWKRYKTNSIYKETFR